MKSTICFLLIISILSCREASHRANSVFNVPPNDQAKIFEKLVELTHNSLPKFKKNDSLAFLILPIQASCPNCRKKSIDSIISNQGKLLGNRYIVVSANTGRKTINSYFKEENAVLPEIDALTIDSTNKAYEYDLCDDKPTIYYTFNGKAYKKVAAIPMTVREDLREFFSGHRLDNN